MEFLALRLNSGAEELRARDLFLALWVSDIFMERVRNNGLWSLFCPHECPGLQDAYGESYRKIYTQYEQAGKAKRTLPARTIWEAMLTSQVETGTPYVLFKNACNSKSKLYDRARKLIKDEFERIEAHVGGFAASVTFITKRTVHGASVNRYFKVEDFWAEWGKRGIIIHCGTPSKEQASVFVKIKRIDR